MKMESHKFDNYSYSMYRIKLRHFAEFIRHLVTYSSITIFQCFICNDKFEIQDLDNHLSFHNDISCEICHRTFTEKKHLKRHMESIHEGIRNNKCEICLKEFYRKSKLMRHLRTHQFAERIFNKAKDYDMKYYTKKCDICEKTFSETRHLITHMESIHEEIKEKNCDICNKQFYKSCDLKRHEATHLKYKNDKKFLINECSVCFKVFTTPSHLKDHFESLHEGIRKHKCKICEKKFYRKSGLVRHLRTHEYDDASKLEEKKGTHKSKTNGNVNKCDICDKLFTEKRHLIAHIESIHNGVKEHECNICGLAFHKASHLRDHFNQVHEEIKNHKCQICGKEFFKKCTLTSHSLIHERQENYQDNQNQERNTKTNEQKQCNLCGKALSCNKKLESHIDVVHNGIKKFKCEMCYRRFAERSKFIKHSCILRKDDIVPKSKNEIIEQVHEEPKQENKNQCNTCGEILPNISDLISHIKVVHLGMKEFN